jgi:ATP/maltotriose-dependent transcriptional regulator MalT
MAALIDALPPTMRRDHDDCRASPPLPLARWRGRGDLAEIRAAELRSDETETPDASVSNDRRAALATPL